MSSLLLVTVITLAFSVGTGYQHTTFGLYVTAFVLSAFLIALLRASYELVTRDSGASPACAAARSSSATVSGSTLRRRSGSDAAGSTTTSSAR